MPTRETPTLDDARQALKAQPFSQLLGAELVAFAAEGTILCMPARDDLLQQHGRVHGGVVAYAADNAMAFAAGARLGPAVVSSSLDIHFVSAARGVSLTATAFVEHASSRRAVVRCLVQTVDQDGEPTTCAVAQGLFTVPDTGERA